MRRVTLEHCENIRRPNSIVPFRQGKKFKNFKNENLLREFIKTLWLLFPGMWAAPYHADPRLLCVDRPRLLEANQDSVTFLGHSTLHIRLNGLNILTDPAISDVKLGCISLYKKYTQSALDISELNVDVIILSHNHQDHAQEAILRELAQSNPQPYIIAGEGSFEWLRSLGFAAEKIKTMSWWEQCRLANHATQEFVDITSVPACHGSQPLDWINFDGTKSSSGMNEMLWMGYVFAAALRTIYFSGDTGLGETMQDQNGQQHSLFDQLHERFPRVDLALMEVEPLTKEEGMHLCREGFFKAQKKLQPKTTVPIHWGCFRMGPEELGAGVKMVVDKALELGGEFPGSLVPLKIGESAYVEELIVGPPDVAKLRAFSRLFAEPQKDHDEPLMQSSAGFCKIS